MLDSVLMLEFKVLNNKEELRLEGGLDLVICCRRSGHFESIEVILKLLRPFLNIHNHLETIAG